MALSSEASWLSPTNLMPSLMQSWPCRTDLIPPSQAPRPHPCGPGLAPRARHGDEKALVQSEAGLQLREMLRDRLHLAAPHTAVALHDLTSASQQRSASKL